MTGDRLVLLVRAADVEVWLAHGWHAATGPRHPVQAAYGRLYVWRWAS